MINIIIDNRETELYKDIIERDLDKYKDKITITKEQLELGDIIIKIDDDSDSTFVYERKTMNDMISSVKDGRYKEQKTRLISNYENINYIIEGTDIICSNNSHSQQLLTSIYYYSMYRDNINVLFTKNVKETVTLILLISTKMVDKPENFKAQSSKDNKEQKEPIEYIDVCKIKSKKISNIDKDTCYLLQLSQIPTISKQLAKNIKEVYPNLKSLLAILEDEKKVEILMKISGIGLNKANKIVEYLCD
jgi:crossover junction endonuclease MUS81